MAPIQKNTDCYFFYYSTCKKGDKCPFRHEPSALGCETMCLYWQQGHCLNEHCNFRHMELKKNRKSIPCFWEEQPGGCRKPHCSFNHKNERTITSDPINPVKTSDVTSKPLNQDLLNRQEDTKYDGSSTESDQGRGSSEAGSFIGSPAVDPLIVKFEEESDNESVPSPVKSQPQPRVPYCKTYEEIRLEEIQAESAAYYSYEADDYQVDVGGGKAARRVVTSRGNRKVCLYQRLPKDKRVTAASSSIEEEPQVGAGPGPGLGVAKELDFEVLSLDEIRRRKRRKALEAAASVPAATPPDDTSEHEDFLKDAIKTLAELRAATAARGLKRGIEESEQWDESSSATEEHSAKRRMLEGGGTSCGRVPPVRLRRSPKRFTTSDSGNIRKSETSGTPPIEQERRQIDLVGEEEEEEEEDEEVIRRRHGRLENESVTSDGSKESREETSGGNRKRDVEIRLCDSSTQDEEQSRSLCVTLGPRMSPTLTLLDDRKSVGTDTTDDSKVGQLSCDSLLNTNEDEYLMLDAAADDILKDIDALLKEKPTC